MSTLVADRLEPIEDRGGKAQPLLQVNGLTKHFPVRGQLFSKRKTRAVMTSPSRSPRAKPSASSANPAAANRPPRGC